MPDLQLLGLDHVINFSDFQHRFFYSDLSPCHKPSFGYHEN